MLTATKPTKAQYTESEAAEVLGISVERLRNLVKDHILNGDEDGGMLSHASYQPSDLLVLRFLTARGVTATTAC